MEPERIPDPKIKKTINTREKRLVVGALKESFLCWLKKYGYTNSDCRNPIKTLG
jgi:hypothetical protein